MIPFEAIPTEILTGLHTSIGKGIKYWRALKKLFTKTQSVNCALIGPWDLVNLFTKLGQPVTQSGVAKENKKIEGLKSRAAFLRCKISLSSTFNIYSFPSLWSQKVLSSDEIVSLHKKINWFRRNTEFVEFQKENSTIKP